MRFALALSGVLICAAALAPDAASAADYDCTPNVTASAYSNAATTTSSTDFVALPGVSAAVPGVVTNNCLLVFFTTQIRAAAPGGVRFRLTFNGTPVGLPKDADFYTSGNKPDERAVTFVLPHVPGDGVDSSVVGIEYMSIDGSPVSAGKSFMSVYYLAN